MNYIPDTHTFIWFLNGDKNISVKARKAIEASGAANFISIASLWEIAIKISLGRLELKIPFEQLADEIAASGFQILPVTFSDIATLSALPFHHSDPFDRLLIAQGINSGFTIISKDSHFTSYPAKILW